MSRTGTKGTEKLARAGPGRPVDMAKRDAILEATRNLILRTGPGVTLEAVAIEAGVSRQTIYNSWPKKELLYQAVIARGVDEIMRPLTNAPEDASVEVTLTTMARAYLDSILEPAGFVILALVIATREQYGPAYFDAGSGRAKRILSDYLRRQVERGVLDLEDPDLAAEHLMGMIKGNYFMKVMLHGPSAIDRDSHERRIRSAVSTFLRAYGRNR